MTHTHWHTHIHTFTHVIDRVADDLHKQDAHKPWRTQTHTFTHSDVRLLPDTDTQIHTHYRPSSCGCKNTHARTLTHTRTQTRTHTLTHYDTKIHPLFYINIYYIYGPGWKWHSSMSHILNNAVYWVTDMVKRPFLLKFLLKSSLNNQWQVLCNAILFIKISLQLVDYIFSCEGVYIPADTILNRYHPWKRDKRQRPLVFYIWPFHQLLRKPPLHPNELERSSGRSRSFFWRE